VRITTSDYGTFTSQSGQARQVRAHASCAHRHAGPVRSAKGRAQPLSKKGRRKIVPLTPDSRPDRRAMAFRSVRLPRARSRAFFRVVLPAARLGFAAIAVCSEADRGGAVLQAADDQSAKIPGTGTRLG